MSIRYEGTVSGFRGYALPALKKAAKDGLSIQDDSRQIQRELRKAMLTDLRSQILGRASGGPPAA